LPERWPRLERPTAYFLRDLRSHLMEDALEDSDIIWEAIVQWSQVLLARLGGGVGVVPQHSGLQDVTELNSAQYGLNPVKFIAPLKPFGG
jgi:hypothetical protein